MKTQHNWTFWGKLTGAQEFPSHGFNNELSISMSWRHHNQAIIRWALFALSLDYDIFETWLAQQTVLCHRITVLCLFGKDNGRKTTQGKVYHSIMNSLSVYIATAKWGNHLSSYNFIEISFQTTNYDMHTLTTTRGNQNRERFIRGYLWYAMPVTYDQHVVLFQRQSCSLFRSKLKNMYR